MNTSLSLPRGVVSLAATLVSLGLSTATAAETPAAREVTLDRAAATHPMDRFFDLSVGADYPGTTGRPENLAQLKTAADELRFRYVRFHDIFHDVYGTVKKAGDKLVFDWSGIDVFFGDDRFVPPDHDDSNEGMARRVLLDQAQPLSLIHI